MMKYLVAFLVFSVLAIVFILLYYLNSKVAKPDSCNDAQSECSSCNVSFCVNKKKER